MIATILTIGIPTLAVLVGILLNRNDANRLDSRITTEIHALRNALQSEISASRKQSHDDILTLMHLAREQDGRLTRLEARS